MVPIFAMSNKTPSPKAREAINNDIVKPIPLSQAAPKIFAHDNSGGGIATPVFTDAQAKNIMPKGFPINSPRATPRLTECVTAATPLPSIRTPALANANNGITRKLIQG
jgi:hypothetical protein